MKPGDFVRFREPETATENDVPMLVLEDNGNRVLVRHEIPGWAIQPTQTLLKSDLEVLS